MAKKSAGAARTTKPKRPTTTPSAKSKQPQKQRSIEPPFDWYQDDTRPTFEEGWKSVIDLLKAKKRIMVLLGAGISVSCGIPDFRTAGSGLYSILDAEELGLTCPEELFDIHFFHENPVPFYKFARQLYFPTQNQRGEPQKIQPSDSHRLLALLEQKKKLLRVYSQNIDALESSAGVSTKKIVYCHGSLQYATCTRCKSKVTSESIEEDILNGSVARCRVPTSERVDDPIMATAIKPPSRKRSRYATTAEDDLLLWPRNVCGGVMKPNVTFFGEALHNTVKTKLESDRDKVDALVVIGTSLSVAPISKVIEYLPRNIPRILINRNIVHPPDSAPSEDGDCDLDEEEEFRDNYVFDAYLLGFCDDVTRALGRTLFSSDSDTEASQRACEEGKLLSEVLQDDNSQEDDATFSARDWDNVRVPSNRVFLFPGAKPPADAEDVSYCEVAHCDGCGKEIRGTIHKCQECFDYDLCQDCFPALSKTHFDGEHDFTVE